jgi:hypothetical protein
MKDQKCEGEIETSEKQMKMDVQCAINLERFRETNDNKIQMGMNGDNIDDCFTNISMNLQRVQPKSNT